MQTHERNLLSDESWERLSALFPKRTRPESGRMFLEAVLFRARTGIPWRDLPERFGPWTTIFTRFSVWSKRGFFQEMSEALREEVGMDFTESSIDSTTVKLHASAHGQKKAQPKAARAAAGRRKSMS